MANTYTSLGGLFTAIANAIRAKKGTTYTIVADNFPSEIESIASQPSLQSKTVSPSTAAQTITPDSGYDGLSQVVVNAISPTKGAQTYTPTTTDQTISSGRWLTGVQTIKGDANLVAGNIKSGVNIFGVTGTYGDYKTINYFSFPEDIPSGATVKICFVAVVDGLLTTSLVTGTSETGFNFDFVENFPISISMKNCQADSSGNTNVSQVQIDPPNAYSLYCTGNYNNSLEVSLYKKKDPNSLSQISQRFRAI